MSAAPTVAILAAFKAALSGPLASQPTWRESAVPGAQDALPSIALQLGDESLTSDEHGDGALKTIRSVRVSVIVADDAQTGAEQCAWEAQEAAPYETVGLGASWSGLNERAEHADADRHYFTIRVNFDVTFETSITF